MLFWILAAAACLMIAALFWLAMLRRDADTGDTAARRDMQVYRDQMAGIERDRARGVLSPEETENARIEISRRMLDADRQDRLGQGAGLRPGDAPKGATWLGMIAVALLIGAAVAGYVWLGRPGYRDEPLGLRLAAAEESYAARPSQDAAEQSARSRMPEQPAPDPTFVELMTKLRDAVALRPNDLTGLDLLSRNEMAIGNYRAGWEAQRRLIALKGDQATAGDYAQLGENMVVAAGGVVTRDAEQAFATALQKDPRDGLSLYYIGLMMAQNGRGDRAFTLWDGLARNTPPDAPWQGPIRAGLPTLAWLAGIDGYELPNGARGPSQADIDAASDMSPEDRAAMIRGMVDALGARLATEGGPVQDWAQLISSLRMLGETGRAAAIAGEARSRFAADPAAIRMIDDALGAPAGAALTPEAPQ